MTTLIDHETKRSIQFLGWAVLLTFWACLGLYLAINSVILEEVIKTSTACQPEGSAQVVANEIRLPTCTRESVWIIVSMWLSAYVIGFIVGLANFAPRRDLIASSILGYLMATSLYLFFLGTFPGTPTNSFDVLRDFASFSALPNYYIFIFLTLILGPVVIGLATYTGILISNESEKLRIGSSISLSPFATIFATFIALSVMLLIVAIPNAANIDEVEQTTRDFRRIVNNYNQTSGLGLNDQETVPVLVLSDLDLATNIFFNSIVAIFVGLIVGTKRTLDSPTQAAMSAAGGIAAYVIVMFLIVELIEPKNTAAIDYSSVYEDDLGSLPALSAAPFIAFWVNGVWLSGATAFATNIAIRSWQGKDQPQTTMLAE